MEKTTAFWESVVAISPVLALAAVVEIRYIQWHRFTALWRYRLGFTAGLVLAALGVAALTALSVLQRWDSGRPIPEWQSELAYWAIYFGVGGVIALPVSQLWVVVFVDFSPTILFHLLQTRRLDRKHSRLLRQHMGLIDDQREVRRQLLIDVGERIISNPSGVFTSSGGLTRVEVTDPVVIHGRVALDEWSGRIQESEKRHKKYKKTYRRMIRDMNKKFGVHPKRAAQAIRRYHRGP